MFYHFYVNNWQAREGFTSAVRGKGSINYEKQLVQFKSEYLSEKKLLKMDSHTSDFLIYSRKAGISPNLLDFCSQVIHFEHYTAFRLGWNEPQN
jgi:hypothetical protein